MDPTLAHKCNNHHSRGIHGRNKQFNHKVNLEKARFRPVQLVRKYIKCCLHSSCEDCKKTKRDAMKLQQVKAVSISPLNYEQTGREILQWPPLPDLDPTGTQSYIYQVL